jgi:putative endopeptidase
MKRCLVFALLMISSFLFSCATTDKATSEIPDRREFPVDPSVNACQDFFQHACGPALKKFKLREDRSRHIFSFSDSHERVLNAKKKYLHELRSQKTFNEKSQQLHDYYSSCMDTEARAREEKQVLAATVIEVQALKTKQDFIDYLIQRSLEGGDSHVGYGNIANLDNSDIYDFIIMPARMTSLPEKSYYGNKELMKEFVEIATEFFTIAGLDNPQKRAQWVADFETDYINQYPTPAEKRPLWSKRAYSTKKKLLSYKNLRLGPVLKKVPNRIKIRNPMDKVFVYLNQALDKYSLDQLKSAYLFQTVEGYMDEGFPDYFKKTFAFSNKYLGGPPKRGSLEERCTESVMNKFTKEIDHELFDSFFPNFPEKKFVGLLEQVRSSILEGLAKNTWLSKKSKANAMKKIKMASFQVVKPQNDKEWDFNPVAQYKVDQYIANTQTLSRNLAQREFERLGQPIDKKTWWLGPLTVNAYYSPTSNKFVMPAGILQYPFYDPKLPDWVNLGAVGAVVGHELGHGVDDQGSKYDERGKVRQWMTPKDVKTFKARGQKLIAQFEAAGHNGELTLGENIGDLVGVTFALNAAKKQMPVDPVARERATKDFFLQWARAWCGVMRPKQVEMRLKTDPHALVWARVNEQMKHQPDFHKVYKCKAGDKLYLPKEEQVTIW